MSYYAKLIENYEKILEADPKSVNAVVNLARLYLKTCNIEKSLVFYEALIDPMPKNVEIFKSMGVLYLAKNEKRESMKYLKKALRLNLRDPSLYEYAAEIDYKNAEECYTIAIEIYTANRLSEVEAMHCFLIAMKLFKKGWYTLSMRYIDVIKGYMSETVEYRNLLGSIYYKREEYDKAIEEYMIAYDLLGYLHHNIAANMAQCYKMKGEYETSLKCLLASLEASDNKKSVYYHLALVYIAMEDRVEALYNLKQSLDIDPNYAPAKDLYSEIVDDFEDEVLSISSMSMGVDMMDMDIDTVNADVGLDMDTDVAMELDLDLDAELEAASVSSQDDVSGEDSGENMSDDGEFKLNLDDLNLDDLDL